MSDTFSVFANAVRTIVEYICEHQEILDFEPEIEAKVWQLVPVIKPQFDESKLLEDLKEHEVVKRSLEFMLREDFPKRLGINCDMNCETYLFLVLIRLAYEYIKEFGCGFNEQKFKDLFNELSSYIYNEEIVTITVLENFELEGAEEVTIDKYRIRKLSEWEIKQIIKLGYANSLGLIVKSDLGVIQNMWCIETQLDMDEFLAIMRLFKRGYVSNSIVLRYPKAGKRFYYILTRSSYHVSLQTAKYVLKLDEVDRLRHLWDIYKRVKDKLPQELGIALKWFNKSREENEVKNKVLELAIAFETMFKDHHYDRLTRSLRPSDISKIRKPLEKLRTERNFIVHQGRSNLRHEELEAVYLNAEEIFREFYTWFLEQIDEGRDYYEIIDKAKQYK